MINIYVKKRGKPGNVPEGANEGSVRGPTKDRSLLAEHREQKRSFLIPFSLSFLSISLSLSLSASISANDKLFVIVGKKSFCGRRTAWAKRF